ncbi:MAG: nucleotide exchange factor GrpE [Balneolaceae bacterium]|nr:nucleotide exchange factor GrpE [Balneolaceae bacterium]
MKQEKEKRSETSEGLNLHEEEITETNEQETGEKERIETEQELDQLIEDQQVKIQELEEELKHVRDTQLRKSAEMDNMRKRLQREREQIFQSAKEAAVQEFLPVSDDLLRTLDAMKNDEAGAVYLNGIKMVANKFDDVLKKYGVTRIDQAGVPFDVNLHDALLSQKADDDNIESGIVLQVVENGYMMGDKTLRHAKVIVSE